ncbi:acyl-CoA thioesterase [Actinotalea sp. AC32]|nr:acyl-CoA thioesterase [Actinotalea sp. AC32]
MSRQIQLAIATTFPRRPVPGLGLLDESVTRTRVRPGDLDLYLHVNNGVYLQMMDVARSNLIADLGAVPLLRRQGWYPVVAASTMTYRRSMRLGDPVEITTRVVGWDPRVVYLEQVFRCRDQPAARGLVAGRFLSRSGGRVPAPDVVELLSGPVTSPALPEDVATWARALDVAHR